VEALVQSTEQLCFFDVETRALPGLADWRWGNITKTSVARYAASSWVIMFQYAIGANGEPKVWQPDPDLSEPLKWRDLPADLAEFMARALKGEAWFVAWNSAFDRHAANRGMVRAPAAKPAMPVRTVLDAMAQAVASNLPGGLDRAHKAIGGEGKVESGKKHITMFCAADGYTPRQKPEDWQEFIDYGLQDVAAAREVFLNTRHLWTWEWEQFWTSEVINDRGLPVDREFVENAAELAGEYQAASNERVKEITGGDLYSVNQHVAMANWVYERLEHMPEATSILTKRYSEDAEGQLVPDKVSLERARIEKLIPYLERLDDEQGLTDDEFDVLRLLEVREYGASATPKKFDKIVGMLDDRDRLTGQYVFNGAQQTGRFSARGAQIHNLTRKAFDREAEALDWIAGANS
jgi:hypothetical protein